MCPELYMVPDGGLLRGSQEQIVLAWSFNGGL